MSDLETTLLEVKLCHEFKSQGLLKLALTHKSHIYESKLESKFENEFYNERLEYLGDSVLQLVITQYLYTEFPQDAEGVLSKKRSSLVNESKLCEIAMELGLQDKVLVGYGEKKSLGHLRPRLLSSTVEALLGAIFLDAGYDKVQEVILKLYAKDLANIFSSEDYNLDFKTRFQELVQKNLKRTPTYELVSDEGGVFQVELKVLDQVLSRGQGQSKKQAEQNAAREILEKLKTLSFTQVMSRE